MRFATLLDASHTDRPSLSACPSIRHANIQVLVKKDTHARYSEMNQRRRISTSLILRVCPKVTKLKCVAYMDRVNCALEECNKLFRARSLLGGLSDRLDRADDPDNKRVNKGATWRGRSRRVTSARVCQLAGTRDEE